MQKYNFDKEWRFKLGDPLVHNWKTMQHSTWQSVDLPHDWSITMDRSPTNKCGEHGGWFTNGMGWYVKAFTMPADWQGKQVLIEFEGVYMNAEIWLNDQYLGRHPYGYTSFKFDLTPYLKGAGEENIIYVSVDNESQRNSRWYSGSGIYRHVWLWAGGPVCIDPWGIAVTTPQVTSEEALVHIKTTFRNITGSPQKGTLQTSILTQDGEVVGSKDVPFILTDNLNSSFEQDFQLNDPDLWSPAEPNLYTAQSNLVVNGAIIETTVTPFGIRSIHFDSRQGFLLNGKAVLLKGGCVHHDDGILGAASYNRSEERKVERLKASGFNAIRCAHNPPAPSFLDACDRLGMLVIDEAFDCWRDGKNPYDYHVSFDDWWQRDLDSMLLRDRNHPSIIMWSIGNEVLERNGDSGGAEIAKMLSDYIRKIDPTRPVTAAINGSHDLWEWERTNALFNCLDVGGYNYQRQQYEDDHVLHPDRIMYGSESIAGEAFEYWMDVLDHPYVIGDFVWTSLDYLGESGIGRVYFEDTNRPFLGPYPWHHANCGDLDLCGFKRPQSYYRDILWKSGEPISIFVHKPIPEGKEPRLTFWAWPDVIDSWTWPGYEGQDFTVDIYADCDAVQLFLDDKLLGTQPSTKAERYISTFTVPYMPGKLRAVAIKNKREVASAELTTTGSPARIKLSPDKNALKAVRGDLCYVTVEVMDSQGARNPQAENQIYFTAKGAGSIAAVGNSDPTSTEPYVGNTRRVYQGKCLVILKTNGTAGDIQLRAMADGLESAEITISVINNV